MASRVGQPQAPALLAPLGFTVGAVRVGHLLEVAKDPPQLGWVQSTRRLHQHRFGLYGDVVRQVPTW